MSYCLNPHCKKPYNPDNAKFCLSCRSPLGLKNRYRTIRPLGEGGMGRTFLALDQDRLNAPCAIKQLLPGPEIQSDSQAMAKVTELFEQEARQLLLLGEENSQIPVLLGYFEQDKRLYLVQQFIEGQTLWQELQRFGAFKEEQIRQLLLDLLPVLQFIHERQVIHRDIKPANIIRREDGRQSSVGQLVLIDFGIAKQLNHKGGKTGTRAGTEGYAPMEQMRGGRAYPASDLYSLGVTCIQLLTGLSLDRLYDSVESRWLWQSHLQQVGRTVSDRLAAILNKMIQDSMKARYPSATMVLQDLNTPASRSFPGKVTPFVPAVPTPPTVATNPLLDYFQGQIWECDATFTGHTAAIKTIALSTDGQIIASGSEDKTIIIWDRHTGKILQTLTQHSRAVTAVAISLDGRLLVSGSMDKTIKFWQLPTGFLLRTLTGHTKAITALTITPDGKTLVSGSADKTLKVWDLRTAQLQQTWEGHPQGVSCVTCSPDGKTIASGSDDGTIKLWNLRNGSVKATLTGHQDRVEALAIASDSQTLASGSRDKTIQTWQLDTGTRLATPKEHSSGFQAIGYLPLPPTLNPRNGHILVSGSEDKTLKFWHQETGNLLHILTGHSDSITCLALSSDGQTIISGSPDKTLKIWQNLNP
ncbi:serine/threonine-protein kinase [Oscillatoria acuminata]|uniref:WD40 repeat-containing protein n=1 Tax=Oscillatoria acuminata PCC 6304 TaxID=56110 RepID=K9TG83_9CYAN|nr:serine/threonine-protein kinase [Oscillatoria acuminata]AFY81039.1 WD40 repeat-containing protein [Oscillatoria acuminata PCC 6304]